MTRCPSESFVLSHQWLGIQDQLRVLFSEGRPCLFIGKFVVKVECLIWVCAFDLYLLSDTLFKIYSSGQIFYNLGHCSGPMYGKYFRPTARTLIVFLLFPKRTVVHKLVGANLKKNTLSLLKIGVLHCGIRALV